MSTNLPINWPDKKNSPLLADSIAKYGSEYSMTAGEINQLRDAVNEMAVVQQSVFLGAAEPTFTPTGTGRAYWLAIKPGTYTNHGGVVVGANELAFIVRDAVGDFSISQTEFILNLEAYVQNSDITIGTDEVVNKNLFDTRLIKKDKQLETNGTITTVVGSDIIDMIPVLPSSLYTISGIDPSGVGKYIGWYDINGVSLGGVTADVNPVPKTFWSPDNAYFLVFGIKGPSNTVESYANAQIEQSGSATTYAPFVPEVTYLEDIKGNKISASYIQKWDALKEYSFDEIVRNGFITYTSLKNKNTGILSDVNSWQVIGGESGGTAYDQSLNKNDSVTFNSVEIGGVLKSGTLSSLPAGLITGEYWLDTTDSAIHPQLRMKL